MDTIKSSGQLRRFRYSFAVGNISPSLSTFTSVSGVSTLTNIHDIDSDIPHFTEATMRWDDIKNGTLPENLKSQFLWDQINNKRIVNELNWSDETEDYRFQLLQNQMSGASFNVVPIANIGTFLNNDVMRVCIWLTSWNKDMSSFCL